MKFFALCSFEQKKEIPSGVVDGINRTFMLSESPLPNTLDFYNNGELQYPTLSYTASGMSIITNVPLAIGDKPYVSYFC